MTDLRLSVLSSGSSGNATYIETDSGGLLVDAGLPPRRIGALLAQIGRTLADVNAAPGVGESLGANTVSLDEPCSVEDLGVTFFEVPHDSMTYGVRVSEGSSAVAMATDLGEAGVDVLRSMSGAEAVVLEANHDPDWLSRGPYSASLKRRIRSR